ncbi:hypothetical protein ACN28S_39605 [Cystobacter fuscus]
MARPRSARARTTASRAAMRRPARPRAQGSMRGAPSSSAACSTPVFCLSARALASRTLTASGTGKPSRRSKSNANIVHTASLSPGRRKAWKRARPDSTDSPASSSASDSSTCRDVLRASGWRGASTASRRSPVEGRTATRCASSDGRFSSWGCALASA